MIDKDSYKLACDAARLIDRAVGLLEDNDELYEAFKDIHSTLQDLLMDLDERTEAAYAEYQVMDPDT